MSNFIKNAYSVFAIGCAACVGFCVETFAAKVNMSEETKTNISLEKTKGFRNEVKIKDFIELGMPGLPETEADITLSEEEKKHLHGMMFLYSYLLDENKWIQGMIHYLLSGGKIDNSIKKYINE